MAPDSVEALSRAMAEAHASATPCRTWNLVRLDRVLDHTPEDMTVTVEAGATLATLQARLASARQWLPIDPPAPQSLTIGALLAANASGPRRHGHGTIREHLIGLKAVLADGRLIKSGGKVVKNVAGYDLLKLFVGSRGTLGIIVEATFKVQPMPAAETFVQTTCDSLAAAETLLRQIDQSPVTSVVLDLHNLDLSKSAGASNTPLKRPVLVAGFAGTEREVEWQLAEAAKLGITQPGNLHHDELLRLDCPSQRTLPTPEPLHQFSVLPSKLCEALSKLDGVPFVARAGNGVVYHRGGPVPARLDLPVELTRRLKAEFDPKSILRELPW